MFVSNKGDILAFYCFCRYFPCFQVEGDYVVYENRMSSTYEVGVGPLGSITRDSVYE